MRRLVIVAAAAAALALAACSGSPVIPPTTPAPTSLPPDVSFSPGPVVSLQPASVSFSDQRHGVLVGDACDRAGHCHLGTAQSDDGGASWSLLPAPPALLGTAGGSATTVHRIRIDGAADGWLYGPDLLDTHDGGLTWARVGVGGPVQDVVIAAGTVWVLEGCRDPSHASSCIAGLLSAGSDAHLLYVIRGLPLLRGASFELARAGRSAWVLDHDSDHLLATSDAGATWRDLPVPCDRGARLAAADTEHLWIACPHGDSQREVLTSDDGAVTWRSAASGAAAPNGPGTMGRLLLTSPSSGLLYIEGGAIWGSDDSARSWHRVLDPGGSGAADLDLIGADAAAAVANHRLYLSGDGGRHWTVHPVLGR